MAYFWTGTSTPFYYETATSGPCEINSTDITHTNGWPRFIFKGTYSEKASVHLSPYIYQSAKEKEYLLRHTVNHVIHSYVQTTGSQIKSYGTNNYLPPENNYTSSATSVTFDRPLWSLSDNSWVSGYRYDDLSGRLDVKIDTAAYDVEYINPTIYDTTSDASNSWIISSLNKKDSIRLKLKQNLNILIPSRGSLIDNIDNPEKQALETFREMVTEKEFRKYLRYGFVLVPGKSGATYQIFRNNWHTKVWRGGKLIEEICVRIKNDQKCPPTDNVIAFMAAISADEDEFKKLGNVYKMAA